MPQAARRVASILPPGSGIKSALRVSGHYGVRRGVTMHGFALNVCDALGGFSKVTPCGIGGGVMTSLEQEAHRPISVREAAMAADKILAGLKRAVTGSDTNLADPEDEAMI